MEGVIAHNDCVRIVYLANYRLGEELEAAKARGEVASDGDPKPFLNIRVIHPELG